MEDLDLNDYPYACDFDNGQLNGQDKRNITSDMFFLLWFLSFTLTYGNRVFLHSVFLMEMWVQVVLVTCRQIDMYFPSRLVA